MTGITRIKILNNYIGSGAKRFKDSEAMWPKANDIYRQLFNYMNCPLEQGYEVIEYTKDEFLAGYDYQLGIDIIFELKGGQNITCQEKILFTDYYSVTVEYFNDWRNKIQGDWFTLKCQYYSVFYDSKSRGIIDDWRIIDWPKTQIATSQGRIRWWHNNNKHDGAKADFKYAYFKDLPDDIIIGSPELLRPKQLELLSSW